MTTDELATAMPMIALFCSAPQNSLLETSWSYQTKVRPCMGKVECSFRPNENITTRPRGSSRKIELRAPNAAPQGFGGPAHRGLSQAFRPTCTSATAMRASVRIE